MSQTKPREIAETIRRALNATRGYQPPGRDLRPGPVETWGPAETADMTVAEPDGSTWTVRVFKGLDDKDGGPADARWFCTRTNQVLYHRLAGGHAECNTAFRPPAADAEGIPEAGIPDYARRCARCAADALHHPRTT
jgi:hypothetical protein